MNEFQCHFEITETLIEEEHVVFSVEEEFKDINSLIEMIDVRLYSYNTENFQFDLEENQSASGLNCEDFDVGVTITVYFDDDSAVLLRIPFDFDEMSLNLNRITVEGDPTDPIARGLFNRYHQNDAL